MDKNIVLRIIGLGLSATGIVVSSLIDIFHKQRLDERDKDDIAKRVNETMKQDEYWKSYQLSVR